MLIEMHEQRLETALGHIVCVIFASLIVNTNENTNVLYNLMYIGQYILQSKLLSVYIGKIKPS